MDAIERGSLGDLVSEKTFATYKVGDVWQADIKRKAVEFANDSAGKWFFVGGQTGCGKTHICTAIVGRMMQLGKPVRYMLWVGESEPLKASVNDAEGYAEAIWPIKNADALYIDDLFKTGARADGRTIPTPADIRLAFDILNYRYLAGMTTIIADGH